MCFLIYDNDTQIYFGTHNSTTYIWNLLDSIHSSDTFNIILVTSFDSMKNVIIDNISNIYYV